jgi:hypothetical protein
VSATFYRVLALAVLAALVWCGLWLYHRRKSRELRQRYAEFEGWRRIRPSMFQEVWQCPDCGVPCFSWPAVGVHDDPETSPCAAFRDRRGTLEEAARARSVRYEPRAEVFAPDGGEPDE